MPKPKMRIKTLNPDLVVLSDRLISMDTEFSTGPTEAHKGPLCVEVTLRDNQDITDFKNYLDKLTGILPITERKPKKTAEVSDDNFREEFVNELKNTCKDQGELIQKLRDRGFVFLNTQDIRDYGLGIDIKPGHEPYQFMVRRIRENKNPIADKYDTAIAIGLRIIRKPREKTLIYMYGKFSESFSITVPAKADINYKKIRPIVFPPFMIEEERLKWAKEHRAIQNSTPDNPIEPSKFYQRWLPSIKLPAKDKK